MVCTVGWNFKAGMLLHRRDRHRGRERERDRYTYTDVGKLAVCDMQKMYACVGERCEAMQLPRL